MIGSNNFMVGLKRRLHSHTSEVKLKKEILTLLLVSDQITPIWEESKTGRIKTKYNKSTIILAMGGMKRMRNKLSDVNYVRQVMRDLNLSYSKIDIDHCISWSGSRKLSN